jgi:hypothetical protein
MAAELTKSINVYLSEGMLEAIDEAAEALGQKRQEWIRAAFRAALDADPLRTPVTSRRDRLCAEQGWASTLPSCTGREKFE